MSTVQAPWPTKRIRFATRRTPPDEHQHLVSQATEVTFLPMKAIGEQGGLDLSAVRDINEVNSGYVPFFDGDVVVAKITPCFENGKGALVSGTLGGVGFGTTELYVLTPISDLNGRFLYFITVSAPFRQLGAASMTGAAGQKRVPEEFVRDYRIPIPPLPQQRAIANYLDRETARLDALVAAKERVLGLLAEKRRALITRAVTRGLDPRAPLRDSGIPWLGKIPAHWKVVQLKFASISLQTGPFGSQLHAEDYVTCGTPVVNPSHLAGGRIHADGRVSVDEATADRLAVHHLSLGDVVFARRGEMGRCGVVEPANVGWLCGTGSIRVRLRRDSAVPYYLALLFAETGISEVLAVQSVGSTMDNLNTDILGGCHVPMPSLEEQRTIVYHVDRETIKIDAIRAVTRRTITLLKERRAALISAAVTGQLEVA